MMLLKECVIKKRKKRSKRTNKQTILFQRKRVPMYEDQNNKNAAQKKMGKSLAGQVFYNTCDDNSDYYRTIFIRFNPFTNAMQPMISNPIYGTPPDGMQPINKMMLARMMRMQQQTDLERVLILWKILNQMLNIMQMICLNFFQQEFEKEISNYALVNTENLHDEESDAILKVYYFERGIDNHLVVLYPDGIKTIDESMPVELLADTIILLMHLEDLT